MKHVFSERKAFEYIKKLYCFSLFDVLNLKKFISNTSDTWWGWRFNPLTPSYFLPKIYWRFLFFELFWAQSLRDWRFFKKEENM